MGSSAMDLDSSLDDIIKNKKQHGNKSYNQRPTQNRQQQQRPQQYNTNNRRYDSGSGSKTTSFSTNASRRPTSTLNRFNNNNDHGRRRPVARSLTTTHTHHGIHSRSRTIGKSSILQRTNLATTPGGGFITKKSISTASLPNRAKQATDPSKIVITKALRGRNDEPVSSSSAAAAAAQGRGATGSGIFTASNSNMSEGISRNGGSNNNNNNLGNAASGGNFNIRGLSGGGGGGISIRGESGPGIVVISNLDPGANAEDVKTACQQFGPVVRCDVMVDHAGRSFGEAEVEFGTKAAALDCVSKLDNEVADGRVLRAVLRSRPGPQPMVSSPSQQQQHGVPAGPASFASQTLRSVIAPTRSGYTSAASGKMYSDQLMGAAAQPAPQQQLPPHQHHSDYARYQSAPTRRY